MKLKPVKNPADRRLDSLGFSIRVRGALRSACICNLAELLERSAQELLLVKDFGRESLREVVCF